MSSTSSPESPNPAPLTHEEMLSALFANLIIQQTNTALLLLGQMPHPETGERMQDLEAAKMFIDQLEMIEVKTKGNLSKPEEQLLKQSLMTLRMAFVKAVESPDAKAPVSGSSKGSETGSDAPRPGAGQSAPSAGGASQTPSGASAVPEEHQKKFSKKY